MVTSNDDGDEAPTFAGAGPTDETTVVPPPTEAAPELAWSLDDGEDIVPVDRHPWSVAWDRAAVLILIGAIIAAFTAIVSWVLIHDRHGSQPPTAAPQPASTAPLSNAVVAYPPRATPPPPAIAAPTPTTTTATKPALPVAVEGSTCRLQSTPTVDADGVPVYCALFPDMPLTAMWSRTPGSLAWPTIGGARVPDQEGSYPWVVVCEQQTGRSYNYCEKAIAQATYQGDGLMPVD